MLADSGFPGVQRTAEGLAGTAKPGNGDRPENELPEPGKQPPDPDRFHRGRIQRILLQQSALSCDEVHE